MVDCGRGEEDTEHEDSEWVTLEEDEEIDEIQLMSSLK